ncbi:MAG: glycosyltransferase family 39 protein [Syntrophales bacterium]|nr:glycosyltransferase family 39 protein [Syntrophales bacterium]
MQGKKILRITKSTVFLAALTTAAACVVRLAFFVGGVRGSDAYAYAKYAYQIATGAYDPTQVFSFYGFRYTVLLPTALSYKLFGVNDISSTIFPYLFSSLQAGFLFLLIDKFIGRKTAIVASILIIFYPLDVIMANILGPDAFIPFFATTALFCYMIGQDRRLPLLYALAGILMGIAYLARVTSIFLFFAVVFYHLIRREKLNALSWMLLGLLVPVAGEALYYYHRTGDPFLHFHRLSVHDDLVKGINPDAIVSLLFYPQVMFGFDLTGLAFYGPLWWLVILGIFFAWKRRSVPLLFLTIALVIPWLGFEFGRQNIREMTPMMKNYNYLSLITAPAIAIAAYGVSSFFVDRGKKTFFISFLGIIIILNLYGSYRIMTNIKDDAAPYEVVAEFLHRAEKRPVYVHHERWVLFLGYFLKYDPTWPLILVDDIKEEASHAYVVLHRRYLEADTAGRPIEPLPLARFWSTSPPSWEKKIEFAGTPAYNSVIVYSIPLFSSSPCR